jgi:hypothetical protein
MSNEVLVAYAVVKDKRQANEILIEVEDFLAKFGVVNDVVEEKEDAE